jgi:predicted amidohydrolase YtcJ
MKQIFLLPSLAVISTLVLYAQAPAHPSRQQTATQSAQIIYFHGNVLTGDGLTTGLPARVSSLAVRDGMIVAAGADQTVLQKWAGSKTERIDLQGAFVVPGLNDAHLHLAMAGREKLSVDLVGARSLQEMLGRIQHAAQTAAPGAWVGGGGWDQTLWKDSALPTRKDLDAVTGNHPAFFVRVDGHIAVVNSAALAAAGFTDHTPDPQGGKLDRDDSGHLTGIVRETAVGMVEAKAPAPNMAMRKKALLLALNDAACHGLTSVQDYSDWPDFLALESLEHAHQLPIRVTEWLTFNDPLDTLEQERGSHPKADRMLNIGMLKGFMDGSLGSRTAAMLAPYTDDPGNSGIPRYSQETLNAMTIARARAGFQMGFHAIGDRANKMALDAYAAAEVADPAARQLRFRIEHAQVVSPGDFERFHQLGVIASMQPAQLLSDMRWAKDHLGPARVPYSYAWKSFLDHGVVLAFGTDYPVEPVTPFRGLYAAVTRENEAGTMSYVPSERLTIGQALYAYTQGSAYAQFAETWKGKLAPGHVADFTVLDRDLTTIAPQEILKTRVLRTVVNGRTVPCVADAEATLITP